MLWLCSTPHDGITRALEKWYLATSARCVTALACLTLVSALLRVTLHYSALLIVTLHYSALLWITPRYAALLRVTLYYSALRCITPRYAALLRVTLHYSALRCFTLRYAVLLRVTLHYSPLLCMNPRYSTLLRLTLHNTALLCITRALEQRCLATSAHCVACAAVACVCGHAEGERGGGIRCVWLYQRTYLCIRAFIHVSRNT